MPHEIKTSRDHPASMAERVNRRLRPSAGEGSGDVQVTRGNSPNRTITTIHHAAGHVPVRDVRDKSIRETMHQKAPGAAK
jgi:hypothetical protein